MSDEGHQLCDDWFPMPEDEPSNELAECPCQGVCCNAYFGETFTGCRGLEGAPLPSGGAEQ